MSAGGSWLKDYINATHPVLPDATRAPVPAPPAPNTISGGPPTLPQRALGVVQGLIGSGQQARHGIDNALAAAQAGQYGSAASNIGGATMASLPLIGGPEGEEVKGLLSGAEASALPGAREAQLMAQAHLKNGADLSLAATPALEDMKNAHMIHGAGDHGRALQLVQDAFRKDPSVAEAYIRQHPQLGRMNLAAGPVEPMKGMIPYSDPMERAPTASTSQSTPTAGPSGGAPQAVMPKYTGPDRRVVPRTANDPATWVNQNLTPGQQSLRQEKYGDIYSNGARPQNNAAIPEPPKKKSLLDFFGDSVATKAATGSKGLLPSTLGDTVVVKGVGRFLPSSKIETTEGELMPMYHGTKKAYAEPDVAMADPQALWGPGHYTTNNPEVAATPGYAGHYGNPGSTPNIHKQFLDIRNPLDLDSKLHNVDVWNMAVEAGKSPDHPLQSFLDSYEKHAEKGWGRGVAEEAIGQKMDHNGSVSWGDVWNAVNDGHPSTATANTEVNKTLQKMGYDGLTHTGTGIGRGGSIDLGEHKVAIAFRNDQIHSAIRPVKAASGTSGP